MRTDSENVRGERLGETVHIPEHVVYRGFASETVALSLASGRYYGLNQSAGRTLDVLRKVPEVSRVAQLVACEYGVSAERVAQDLQQLCTSLIEIGLVVPMSETIPA